MATTVDARIAEPDAPARRSLLLGAPEVRLEDRLDRPLRWAALAVSAGLASPELAVGDVTAFVWLVVLTVASGLRTLNRSPLTNERAPVLGPSLDVLLAVAAVSTTGTWTSPFVPCLIAMVVLAGLGSGPRVAAEAALVVTVAVFVAGVLVEGEHVGDLARMTGQWGMVLVLVALVAGYARRISIESAARHSETLDHLSRLAEANSLLFALHRVAQRLPASLDLDEVLDESIVRLRELFRFDALTVLVLDDTERCYVPVRNDGNRSQPPLGPDDLPPVLRRAAADAGALVLHSDATPFGLAPLTRSGVYIALRPRDALIGFVAVESHESRAYQQRDGELLGGLAEPLALAIDNARWFGRLRTVGAEEERTRIARDLHDRIGQSLAYLAFELDRIVRSEARGDPVGASLLRLRDDLRGVVTEVRDTLYDLRTDVSEEQGVRGTLAELLARVGERSTLAVTFRAEESERLPLPQEREIVRIAGEAITNAERHSGARNLAVTWRADGSGAELVVADDGIGISAGSGRMDSYGILGMRERAAAINATLDIEGTPGAGTTVRVRLSRQGG